MIKTKKKFLEKENNECKTSSECSEIIANYKQMIFYGPPGTGKTREAKRIAYELITNKKLNDAEELEDFLNKDKEIRKQFKNQCKIVVFHPSYEYDDFMLGIKPLPKGKKLNFDKKIGTFYELCKKAEANKNKNYVIIIDEINRGNLSKLLGELVYALEYRNSPVNLPITGEKFIIPENVYIIGTMNSADRSIGHIDVAIRRRFALVYMGPETEVVKNLWAGIGDSFGDKLATFMKELNEKLQEMAKSSGIVVDEKEIGIGHSYFLPKINEKKENIENINNQKEYLNMKWNYFVLPLLKEYALQFGEEKIKEYLKENYIQVILST